MEDVGKFLVRWIIMILIIGAYVAFRDIIGWDEGLDWSRFADFSALGTLGLFLLAVYSRKKAD
jgi:hypothetical protein|uniref:YpkL n=1 Tax=Corynebacterium jeikeium TaxID=38289 RepID=Q8RN52_CORJE|nr:hypothetical protein [Corynebacterium jeikeium]AAL96594.1 YpkL [Corynebacterium jeikeium]